MYILRYGSVQIVMASYSSRMVERSPRALKTIAPKIFEETAALAVKGGTSRIMRTASTLRAARLVEEQAPTPLLTKPVSKNTVFLGKIAASFLTLLGIYTFLTVYVTVGGILIEGPQNNLQLVPLGLVGLTLAILVWASLVILLGTLSKSSLVAALGSFGIWIGVTIAGGILGSVFGQTTILLYAPGSGATGSTTGCGVGRFEAGGTFATGTDNLGSMLMQWALNGNTTLNFCGFRFRGAATETFLASSDTIANVALRDLGVTLAYLAVFLFLSWYAFRRSQIIESA